MRRSNYFFNKFDFKYVVGRYITPGPTLYKSVCRIGKIQYCVFKTMKKKIEIVRIVFALTAVSFSCSFVVEKISSVYGQVV